MEIRTKAVVFYEEGIRSAKEIEETYNISERTVRRWAKAHSHDQENGLRPKKTGPKRSPRVIPRSLEQRIIRLKEKYPAWGAPFYTGFWLSAYKSGYYNKIFYKIFDKNGNIPSVIG